VIARRSQPDWTAASPRGNQAATNATAARLFVTTSASQSTTDRGSMENRSNVTVVTQQIARRIGQADKARPRQADSTFESRDSTLAAMKGIRVPQGAAQSLPRRPPLHSGFASLASLPQRFAVGKLVPLYLRLSPAAHRPALSSGRLRNRSKSTGPSTENSPAFRRRGAKSFESIQIRASPTARQIIPMHSRALRLANPLRQNDQSRRATAELRPVLVRTGTTHVERIASGVPPGKREGIEEASAA